ncbi:hypothetical protein BJX66DRAFT_313931 [Aspergillus keveii]|uniref:Uncharacterized protein n=1 Tax=Aspergillus keveii TaxID=714993 RepID=A0ABR4FRN7_9EURO
MRHCDQVELPDIRTYLTYLSWLSHTVTNRVPDSTEQSLDRQAFIPSPSGEQNQTITKPLRFDLTTRLDERATQREHSNLIYQNPRYWQSHSQLPSPGAAPNATSESLASAEKHAHDLRSRPPSTHHPQQTHPSQNSSLLNRVCTGRERGRQAGFERLAPWRFSRRPRLASRPAAQPPQDRIRPAAGQRAHAFILQSRPQAPPRNGVVGGAEEIASFGLGGLGSAWRGELT